jgi:peptidoglycan/xylan/chitin deacetylase (PgdA/CDA1 family)
MNSIFNKIPLPWSFSRLRKMAGVNPLVVNYHVVSDQYLPHINNIYRFRNTESFTIDLDFLSSHYKFINLPQLLTHLQKGTKLPDNALLFTIDDGLKEVHSVMAPILKKKKIEPVLFLTKNYIDNKELGYDHRKSLIINKLHELNDSKTIENKLTILFQQVKLFNNTVEDSILGIPYDQRHIVDSIARMICVDYKEFLEKQSPYLTSSDIKELVGQGFALGGHSVDHPNFRDLTLEDQLFQAKESMDFVNVNFHVNYRVFAFPYWDAGISQEFFRELGADATFGTQGLLSETIPNHIQRIGFERFNYPAKQSIKAHYFRKMLLSKMGRGVIIRP